MALEIGKNAPAGKYSNVSLLVDKIVSFRSFIFFSFRRIQDPLHSGVWNDAWEMFVNTEKYWAWLASMMLGIRFSGGVSKS